MNKYQEYQEALNFLKKIEKENTYKRIGLFNHTQCDILQELVDKATPKKVKPFPNSLYIKTCPDCDLHLSLTQNYCDRCGQKLDWEVEDD